MSEFLIYCVLSSLEVANIIHYHVSQHYLRAIVREEAKKPMPEPVGIEFEDCSHHNEEPPKLNEQP